MLHMKFKRITIAATRYQKHVFCLHTPSPRSPPPLTLGMGSVGQNTAFSEHGHVAYQIKENYNCSNMVPNILTAATPPPHTHTLTYLPTGSIGHKILLQIHLPLNGPEVGVKMSKFHFQNMVMLRIKLKGIRNAATW